VVNQLRINTKNSFHRYDVTLLLNGLPLVQIELKSLQISPRRAMQQIFTPILLKSIFTPILDINQCVM
jgi:type I site-specific restriction-modification system R (restriction) subunit